MEKIEISEKQKKYLAPCITNYYKEPLILDRGKGKYLYDIDGREYLDFFGGIVTISVGHCDDEITSKTIEQMKKLQHTSTLYPNVPIVSLAEKIAQITPGRLQKSFFTNSGTEAIETAILIAQMYTKSHEVIALRHCYSGSSLLAMNITAHGNWRLAEDLIPGIKHAHNAYCFRCAFGREYPHCDLECARGLEASSPPPKNTLRKSSPSSKATEVSLFAMRSKRVGEEPEKRCLESSTGEWSLISW